MSLLKPYYSDKSVVIYNADCKDILPHLKAKMAERSAEVRHRHKISTEGFEKMSLPKLKI